MSQEPSDQDGQLYTLGLLERLRTQTGLAGAAFSDMHSRVDKLLREISNPNLHDIANMSYRVELWDKYALHIRWTVAAVGHIYSASRIRRSRQAMARSAAYTSPRHSRHSGLRSFQQTIASVILED
jgi:hypothetical protein